MQTVKEQVASRPTSVEDYLFVLEVHMGQVDIVQCDLWNTSAQFRRAKSLVSMDGQEESRSIGTLTSEVKRARLCLIVEIEIKGEGLCIDFFHRSGPVL